MRTNKKPLIIFSVVLILALISSIILRMITPQTIIVPEPVSENLTQNIVGGTTSFSNISFSGTTPNFSARALVLKKIQDTSPQLLEQEIVTKLNLKKSTLAANYWQNDQDQSLTYDRFNQAYFLIISPITEITNPKLSQTELIANAQSYLLELLSLELSPLTNQITYYLQPEEHPEETTYEQATAVKIPFAQTVDGIPLMFEGRAEVPFFVTLDMAGNVSTVSFTPNVITFQTLGEKNLISTDQAIDNINTKNQGTIISAGVETTIDIKLEDIVGGGLTSVSLEYRADSTTGYVLPYYRFAGTVYSADNNKYLVELITPAVETEPADSP